MKWVLCGITFALSVALAVGTASYRAGNTKMRLQIEREYRSIEARRIEVRRLSLAAAERATPERLCDRLRDVLRASGAVAPKEPTPWQ
jgi:hypothetical protein